METPAGPGAGLGAGVKRGPQTQPSGARCLSSGPEGHTGRNHSSTESKLVFEHLLHSRHSSAGFTHRTSLESHTAPQCNIANISISQRRQPRRREVPAQVPRAAIQPREA